MKTVRRPIALALLSLAMSPVFARSTVTLPGEAETRFFGVFRLGVTLDAAGATPTAPGLPYRCLGIWGKFWL